MKAKHLLLISVTATLPIFAVMAQDASKTETTAQKTTGEVQNKPAAGKDQVTCDCNSTNTNLDKLVAEMNGATTDKKVDAIAAVVTKLAEEFKAAQQQTETKTAKNEKSEMGMCKMMMGMNMKESGNTQDQENSHHH